MVNKVKAFGEVMMKLNVPGYTKLEQANRLDLSFSGTGVNVLAAMSRFGHSASIITALPDNSVGDAAATYLRSLGIATDDIQHTGAYMGMYFLENGFDRRASVVTYSNRKESSFCQSSAADYPLEKLLQDTAMLHFCGIGLAVSEQTRELLLTVAKMAKKAGVTVVFDCNYREKLWLGQEEQAKATYEAMLAHTDICFMTERDAISILGMETAATDQKEQLQDLLPSVAKQFGIQTIAGTIRQSQNEKSSIQGFLLQQDRLVFSKPQAFRILERIGGGDGFASGILHGLLSDYSLEDTVEFAAASGALAHMLPGDSPRSSEKEVWRLVTRSEIEMER